MPKTMAEDVLQEKNIIKALTMGGTSSRLLAQIWLYSVNMSYANLSSQKSWAVKLFQA